LCRKKRSGVKPCVNLISTQLCSPTFFLEHITSLFFLEHITSLAHILP